MEEARESDAPIVEVRNLAKAYGRVRALGGLDLTVREGEVYGFLGRNGAGKTTAIRIIMGISRPNAGTVHLFGERVGRNAARLRQRVGYAAQEQNFYGWMTPVTIGRFVRGFFPTWDDAEYVRLVQALDLPSRRKIRTFSGGMRAKLALALALSHRPRLLILDEPTSGLDPVARREFIETVRDQAEKTGRTTFFSSHRTDEVELAADRVGILDRGRMLFEGPLETLSSKVRLLRLGSAEMDPRSAPLPSALADIPDLEVLQDHVRKGEREVILQGSGVDHLGDTLPPDSPWTIEGLSLEDIFIAMVSRPLGAGA